MNGNTHLNKNYYPGLPWIMYSKIKNSLSNRFSRVFNTDYKPVKPLKRSNLHGIYNIIMNPANGNSDVFEMIHPNPNEQTYIKEMLGLAKPLKYVINAQSQKKSESLDTKIHNVVPAIKKKALNINNSGNFLLDGTYAGGF